jgi:predicted nucleotidyltransferase
MSRNDILSILGDYKRRTAREYGILEIGVFGSVARDEATENSDVDIFIKTETPNPFVLVHIKQDIENLLHQRIDLVRMRDLMNPFLKGRVEREGVYV